MHRFNLCFVFTFFAATFSSIAAPNLTAAEPPSNVLFIAIDDMKTIGTLYSEEPGNFLQRVYPDKALRTEIAKRMTPNLQRLADRGVTFMSAYCAAPACNPSRAALMTGVRPHVTGLTTNAGGVFFRDYEYEGNKALAEAVTLPELLQKHGWYTAETGKIFHSDRSFKHADGNRSWTDVQGNAGPSKRDRFSPKSLDWGQEGDDNTMIILWSDHGYHLGEKLHETKFTLWDDGANVNFIISDPRNRNSAGQSCKRPVTLTDIYPTVAAMAGVELPDVRIKGNDLAPLLADPNRVWATPAHSTYQEVSNNMVRTDRYKLIRYGNDNKAVELYDMQEDPEEFMNLAGKPQQESTEAKLKSLLDAAIR